MALISRVLDLKKKLPAEHQSIAHFVEHALQSIENYEEEHRKLTASNALYGEHINGELESLFYQTILGIKQQLVQTLEKTVADYSHKGDKNWTKNFKDGVD